MQTTVIFKTDKKLKEVAQKRTKFMNDFGKKPLTPTPYLRRLLIQGEKDLKSGKNIERFDSLEAAFADILKK